jgi:hypothetical protein
VRLVVLLALLAAPAALASHPSQHRELKANLDGDRALERVIAVEDVSRDHSIWRASVRIVDRCAGRNRSYQVAAGFQRLGEAKAEQVDGRGPKEVLGVVYSPTATDGVARLVRLVSRPGRCPALRTLFAYTAARTDRPASGFELTQFTVEIVELDARYPGRELRLTELFQTPPMLSSIHREKLYRYVRARDGYVLYATNTHRIP